MRPGFSVWERAEVFTGEQWFPILDKSIRRKARKLLLMQGVTEWGFWPGKCF
jgi:hypothetical protein